MDAANAQDHGEYYNYWQNEEIWKYSPQESLSAWERLANSYNFQGDGSHIYFPRQRNYSDSEWIFDYYICFSCKRIRDSAI